MKYVLLIIIPLFFFGCNLINPEEQVPSYLYVEKPTHIPPSEFSSKSHNVTDMWVFANGSLLGAFELPAEIPVLEEGETSFRLIPGIYKDGIKSHRHFYSYYQSIDSTINLVPESTTTITPSIKYNNLYEVVFNEDFEGIEFEFEQGSDVDTILLINNEKPIDGLKSAVLYANKDSAILEIVSKELFTIGYRPQDALPYLEIDYKSSTDFVLGVLYNNQINAELVLRANTERKKIYIDLSSEIGVFGNDVEFKLSFQGFNVKKGDYIALDNIRLLKPKE